MVSRQPNYASPYDIGLKWTLTNIWIHYDKLLFIHEDRHPCLIEHGYLDVNISADVDLLWNPHN